MKWGRSPFCNTPSVRNGLRPRSFLHVARLSQRAHADKSHSTEIFFVKFFGQFAARTPRQKKLRLRQRLRAAPPSLGRRIAQMKDDTMYAAIRSAPMLIASRARCGAELEKIR